MEAPDPDRARRTSACSQRCTHCVWRALLHSDPTFISLSPCSQIKGQRFLFSYFSPAKGMRASDLYANARLLQGLVDQAECTATNEAGD